MLDGRRKTTAFVVRPPSSVSWHVECSSGIGITTQALGTLETEILQLIWACTEPVTVKDIHRVLASRREIAYTTVMTTMSRLVEKGILQREPIAEHRHAAYRYTVLLRHQDVLLARVEQVLAGADEVERQYVAAEIRRGRRAVRA